VTVFDYTEDR